MVLPVKAELLKLLKKIPLGRVTSPEALGGALGLPPALVATLLAQFSEDERELVPWHRVVARGGAIGRGAHRDQQFARLVREGVMVSPAGIVQDLARHMISAFDDVSFPLEAAAPAPKSGRSRGIKERP